MLLIIAHDGQASAGTALGRSSVALRFRISAEGPEWKTLYEEESSI